MEKEEFIEFMRERESRHPDFPTHIYVPVLYSDSIWSQMPDNDKRWLVVQAQLIAHLLDAADSFYEVKNGKQTPYEAVKELLSNTRKETPKP